MYGNQPVKVSVQCVLMFLILENFEDSFAISDSLVSLGLIGSIHKSQYVPVNRVGKRDVILN